MDEQSIAQVELLELEQIAVASLPRPRLQVASQPGEAALNGRGIHQREHRDPRAHGRIEVGVRAPPVGVQEAVDAVVGDRDRLDTRSAEPVDRVLAG